jgi:hypothetical protein
MIRDEVAAMRDELRTIKSAVLDFLPPYPPEQVLGDASRDGLERAAVRAAVSVAFYGLGESLRALHAGEVVRMLSAHFLADSAADEAEVYASFAEEVDGALRFKFDALPGEAAQGVADMRQSCAFYAECALREARDVLAPGWRAVAHGPQTIIGDSGRAAYADLRLLGMKRLCTYRVRDQYGRVFYATTRDWWSLSQWNEILAWYPLPRCPFTPGPPDPDPAEGEHGFWTGRGSES